MMLYTTFRKLKNVEGWDEQFDVLARAMDGWRAHGVDTPIPLTIILETCGVDAAVVWGITSCGVEAIDFARRFSLACVKHVEDLIDSPDVKNCTELSGRFLDGEVTRRELMNSCFQLETSGDARIDNFINSAAGLVEMAVLSRDTEKILGAAATAVRDCYFAADMVGKELEELQWIRETFQKMLEVE